MRLLGHVGEVDRECLSAALEKIFSAGLDEVWSASCLDAVDGLGAPRVVVHLLKEARQ